MAATPTPRGRRVVVRLMLTMAAGYLFESLLLLGFWRAGFLTFEIAAAFCGVFAGGWLLLWVVFAWRWNLRFRDPTLFLPLYAFSLVFACAMLMLAPQIAIQPMATLSVIFVHSFTAPDRRSFAIAWTLSAIGVIATLVLVGDRLGMPSSTAAGRALILLVMLGCLVRCMGFASYVRQLQRRIREKNAALQTALARNEELLRCDELTGVANRRSLMRFLGEQQALFERTGVPFSVALIDVDLFKRVNDEHGHVLGDQVLAALAQTASGMTRASDCFGRYGGEEFMLLFAATRLAEARLSLERIRAGIEAHDWPSVAPGIAVTVTCGLAQFRPGDAAESVIRRADAALYAGKKAGRNRIEQEDAEPRRGMAPTPASGR